MPLTMAAIRALYPAPMKSIRFTGEIAEGKYCVGGACMLAHNEYRIPGESVEEQCFPGISRLADFLVILNPRLTSKKAYIYAGHIVDTNDGGNFERAWTYLDHALTRGSDDDI